MGERADEIEEHITSSAASQCGITIESAYTAASSKNPNAYNPKTIPVAKMLAGLEACVAFSFSSAFASRNSSRMIC